MLVGNQIYKQTPVNDAWAFSCSLSSACHRPMNSLVGVTFCLIAYCTSSSICQVDIFKPGGACNREQLRFYEPENWKTPKYCNKNWSWKCLNLKPLEKKSFDTQMRWYNAKMPIKHLFHIYTSADVTYLVT